MLRILPTKYIMITCAVSVRCRLKWTKILCWANHLHRRFCYFICMFLVDSSACEVNVVLNVHCTGGYGSGSAYSAGGYGGASAYGGGYGAQAGAGYGGGASGYGAGAYGGYGSAGY